MSCLGVGNAFQQGTVNSIIRVRQALAVNIPLQHESHLLFFKILSIPPAFIPCATY